VVHTVIPKPPDEATGCRRDEAAPDRSDCAFSLFPHLLGLTPLFSFAGLRKGPGGSLMQFASRIASESRAV
jgi:hypothetical protein